ncbi:MAG: hypothetical protein M4579_005852 [Chaenotheca gracillima]|nr:MAG: hypothetical protein M4579_005852 [Chaenotheca gracillima]
MSPKDILWNVYRAVCCPRSFFRQVFGKEKLRLYVSLYARGGVEHDRYHWALTTGPKTELETDDSFGLRFHVKQIVDPKGPSPNSTLWQYEQMDMKAFATRMILIRVLIAKVLDYEKLEEIIRNAPVVQDDPSWTCRIWVKNTVAILAAKKCAIGTSTMDWAKIEETARTYVRQKKDEHRFDGMGHYDRKVATWDVIEGQEIVV